MQIVVATDYCMNVSMRTLSLQCAIRFAGSSTLQMLSHTIHCKVDLAMAIVIVNMLLAVPHLLGKHCTEILLFSWGMGLMLYWHYWRSPACLQPCVVPLLSACPATALLQKIKYRYKV